MPLRRSPTLTPRALLARRLNSLKSTGPLTARGEARSCLNALRHGQRSDRRTFRDKLVRTGDSEAVYLFDLIFEELLRNQENPSEFVWRRLESLAVRAWCIESGWGRRVAKTCLRTKLESGVRIYRYAEKFVVPRRLKIANKAGWGFMLINPTPSRRRRVASGWIPEVQRLEGALPKARRVRGGCKPGMEIVRSAAGQRPEAFPGAGPGPGGVPESSQSRWGAMFKAVGRLGSAIFRRLGGSKPPSWDQEGLGVVEAQNHHPLFPSSERRGDPISELPSWDQEGLGVVDVRSSPRRPPPPEDWEDPEDYEAESMEEFLIRHKFLAKLALWAAQRSRNGGTSVQP